MFDDLKPKSSTNVGQVTEKVIDRDRASIIRTLGQSFHSLKLIVSVE